MFCPKCGSKLEEGDRVCPNCGIDLPASQPSIEIIAEKPKSLAKPSTVQVPNKSIRTIFFVLAGIVLALSFYSAHCIAAGGLDISSIESVGGTTLEEAYYQYSGMVYAGYATAVRASGFFFASVLAYLGIKG